VKNDNTQDLLRWADEGEMTNTTTVIALVITAGLAQAPATTTHAPATTHTTTTTTARGTRTTLSCTMTRLTAVVAARSTTRVSAKALVVVVEAALSGDVPGLPAVVAPVSRRPSTIIVTAFTSLVAELATGVALIATSSISATIVTAFTSLVAHLATGVTRIATSSIFAVPGQVAEFAAVVAFGVTRGLSGQRALFCYVTALVAVVALGLPLVVAVACDVTLTAAVVAGISPSLGGAVGTNVAEVSTVVALLAGATVGRWALSLGPCHLAAGSNVAQ